MVDICVAWCEWVNSSPQHCRYGRRKVINYESTIGVESEAPGPPYRTPALLAVEESNHLTVDLETVWWWRHQMETVSTLLALYAGNSPVTGEFSAQRPVARSLDVFFDLRLNKRLSRQSWGWWSETPLRPLWRHCNANIKCNINIIKKSHCGDNTIVWPSYICHTNPYTE